MPTIENRILLLKVKLQEAITNASRNKSERKSHWNKKQQAGVVGATGGGWLSRRRSGTTTVSERSAHSLIPPIQTCSYIPPAAPHSNLLIYPTSSTIFSIHNYNQSSLPLYAPYPSSHLQHICTIQLKKSLCGFKLTMNTIQAVCHYLHPPQLVHSNFASNSHEPGQSQICPKRIWDSSMIAFVQSPGSWKIPGSIPMLLVSWGVLAWQADWGQNSPENPPRRFRGFQWIWWWWLAWPAMRGVTGLCLLCASTSFVKSNPTLATTSSPPPPSPRPSSPSFKPMSWWFVK